jgi:anti-sigma B factor antagonist
MKILKRDVGNITVLELKGKITIGTGDVALRDAVDEVMNRGGKNLLVDLKGVSKMDSSGLGELIAAHNSVTADGGKIKLVNMPSKMHNVLGVTQIVSVFDVFDDVDEALASFG